MLSGRNYKGMLEASHGNSNTALSYGLDIMDTMDKVGQHDDETQGSGSGSGSGMSDLSALGEETDDFGRRLLQHQRDVQRLKAMRGSQPAFRKARPRPRPRVAELLEREEREAVRRDELRHQRSSSDGSNDHEPPVTIPRDWGRKARRQTDWMRKILEPSEPSVEGEDGGDTDAARAKPAEDAGAIFAHRTAFTGDVDWRAGAGEPQKSDQQDHQQSSPTSMRHMNTTLRSDIDSEDGLDFSSVSLLTSTPVRTRHTRKIDELARREIEIIEQQCVATRTLDQMEERSPNGTLRRTSSTNLRQRAIATGLIHGRADAMRSAPTLPNAGSTSRIPRRTQRSPQRNNQENIPPNGDISPRKVDVSKGLSSRSQYAVKQRPAHQRGGSMDLLRKLARVSSMSPSPDKVQDVGDGGKRPASANDAIMQDDGHATAPVSRTGRWGFGGLLSSSTRRARSSEAKKEEIKEENEASAETQAKNVPLANVNTPVVTGAWVDTTVQNGDRLKGDTRPSDAIGDEPSKPKAEPISLGENLRRTNSEPGRRPNSALEAILRENDEQQNSQLLGESTLQSLEAIVNPAVDATDLTNTIDLDEKRNNADIAVEDGLSQDQKDRRQEDLALEGLDKHLRAARTSIKDANRGLRRVENRIEIVQDAQPAVISSNPTIVVASSGTHGFIPCPHCGGGYHSVSSALWFEFRSCFYTYTHPHHPKTKTKRTLHLTPLTLSLLLFTLWYLTENLLCLIFCKPSHTSRHWDVDPWNTPIYPFTIPTFLIGRPLRWILGDERWAGVWRVVDGLWPGVCDWCRAGGPPCRGEGCGGVEFVERGTVVLSTSVLAASVPSVARWGSEWATTATARVVGSLVEAVDEVGSMWDDEMVL